jgi:hydroxyacylglutathione hydrolase
LRLSGWRGLATTAEPLLLVLHVAYAWLGVGFLLLGAVALGMALPETAALHALTVGGIGGVILGMITRVALGHTGRPLHAARLIQIAYLLLNVSALFRSFGPLDDQQHRTRLYRFRATVDRGLRPVRLALRTDPRATARRPAGRAGQALMSLQVLIVPVTAFQQNCSVIWCTETMHGAVVDPGGDLEEILAGVQEHGIQLTKILLTHAHIDHAGATAELARRFKLPIEGPHEGDRYWIEQLPAQARSFGFGKAEKFEPDRWLQQGDTVQVGNETLEVLSLPWPYARTCGVLQPLSAQLCFVGDVLFAGSIGRTDFPGSDYATLINSITHRLWPLGNAGDFCARPRAYLDFRGRAAGQSFCG